MCTPNMPPSGLRYALQICSDDNRFVETLTASAAAPNSPVDATVNLSEAHGARSWLDRMAQFKQQMEMVLHDRELYRAARDQAAK